MAIGGQSQEGGGQCQGYYYNHFRKPSGQPSDIPQMVASYILEARTCSIQSSRSQRPYLLKDSSLLPIYLILRSRLIASCLQVPLQEGLIEVILISKIVMGILIDSNSFFIKYILVLVDLLNKVNIVYQSLIKCKRITKSVLAFKLYAIAHSFNIRIIIKATVCNGTSLVTVRMFQ